MGERPGGAEHSLGFVDLAAIGSVADVVPITGENRAIVRLGLRRLSEAPRPGLAALLAAARLDTDDVSRDDIAFGLAPRINAMGRIGDPAVAAALLLARDDAEAAGLAAQLEAADVQRRAMTATAIADARASLDGATDDAFIVLEGDWPVGIIGLVAGRLAGGDRSPRPGPLERRQPVAWLGTQRRWRGRGCSAGGLPRSSWSVTGVIPPPPAATSTRPKSRSCGPGSPTSLPTSPRRTADRPSPSTSSRAHLRRITYSCGSWHRWRTLLRRLRSVGVAGLVVVRARVASGGHTQLTLRRGRDVVDGISFGRADLAEQLREGLENRRRGAPHQPDLRGTGDAAAGGAGRRSGGHAERPPGRCDGSQSGCGDRRQPGRTGEPGRPGVTGRPPVPPPGGGAGYPPGRPPVGHGRVPTGRAPGSRSPSIARRIFRAQEPLPPRSRPPRNSPVLAPLLAFIGLLLVGAGSVAALTFLNVDS